MGLFDPPPPGNMTTSDGKVSTPAYNWFRTLGQNLASAVAGLGVVQSQQEAIDFSIEYPQNQVYPWEINAPYGYTITQVDSDCASGSCTATVKIGATALGGGANSVSTTLQSKSHTTDNVVALNGTTSVTISANSSCQLLRLTAWITRT